MSRRDEHPTHTQMVELVRFVARTCLEVERGLRPPAHLARFMDPAVALGWRHRDLVGRFHAGPVRDTDIGPPHLSHVSDRLVHATVTTRTSTDRWGALVLQLRAEDGSWMLTDIQRLLAAKHYRSSRNHGQTVEVPLAQRIDRASQERRVVDAALQATRKRITELPAGPARDDARRLRRSWQRIAGQLDRELVDLRSRREVHRAVRQARRR